MKMKRLEIIGICAAFIGTCLSAYMTYAHFVNVSVSQGIIWAVCTSVWVSVFVWYCNTFRKTLKKDKEKKK